MMRGLVHILEQNHLPAIERAAAGRHLAHLGDDRPGVTLQEDGLPDIAWCDVPAGRFMMGAGDELHPVTLPGYKIGRYSVTNAQYASFVKDGGYTEKWRSCWTEAGWRDKEGRTEPLFWTDVRFNQANQPVVGITWYEAVAFCRWLTGRLREAGKLGANEIIRLSTSAEWEKAARGPDGRTYPWGEEVDPDKANYEDTGIGTTTAVGCFPAGASPYDCLDMSGNMWEWCATKYGKSYPYEVAENEWSDDYLQGTDDRVVRGGAFLDDGNPLRCAVRYGSLPYWVSMGFGFRVVLAPIDSES